ncbi:hypothetical protein [Paracoccus ravus]|uniref:hypothetical protein n=1 Tax=Paracoccus ravus TaxID=2447760 RepID=UPI0014303C51|nr:hypothetical protein [Paracoccus ravus]
MENVRQNQPLREVAQVHPQAMPIILTRPEEWRAWLPSPLRDPALEGAREEVA